MIGAAAGIAHARRHGGVVRRAWSCSPRSSSPGPARATSSTPCAASADLHAGDHRHRRVRPDPDLAARPLRPVQHRARLRDAAQDARRRGDDLRRCRGPPVRRRAPVAGRGDDRADGDAAAPGVRLRGRRSAWSCWSSASWLLALTPAHATSDCRRASAGPRPAAAHPQRRQRRRGAGALHPGGRPQRRARRRAPGTRRVHRAAGRVRPRPRTPASSAWRSTSR